jgi:hypothetical protein
MLTQVIVYCQKEFPPFKRISFNGDDALPWV